MPVGDCQREFAAAAAKDGIELTSQAFPWLCQQGHFALHDDSAARETLRRIYIALGGDEEVLAAGRTTRLTGDFLHEPTRTLIEIDELQHFTTARLTTLDEYPDSLPLGFSLDTYKALAGATVRRQTATERRRRREGLAPVAAPGSAPITTLSGMWRRLRWAIRRWCALRPHTATV